MQLSEDDEPYVQNKEALEGNPSEDMSNKFATSKFGQKFKIDTSPLDENFRDISEFEDPKSTELIKPSKTKSQSEDNIEQKPDMEDYLRMNISPEKEFKSKMVDRDPSIASNISNTFGYNQDDFNPFGQKNMNLSKPQEINFDNLKMNPNASYVGHMMSKISDNSKLFNKQVSLTLNFINYDMVSPMESDNTNIYDLNQLSGNLNISLTRNKRIELEMIDDTHVRVKTSSKSSSLNSGDKKDASIPMNISRLNQEPSFSLIPVSYPSFPNEMMNSNKFSQFVNNLKSGDQGCSSSNLESPLFPKKLSENQ
mmetsp:Transcript_22142/g.21929  ORF Transcript_22142/g.21929 Transcript_22142/m.21929 type:complete len:310 (-) Transcript_22142:34-963(-)